ncbi:hypothetical protein TNCV_3028091 [Trichonephila clavipes]|nr:hypothetical protein TNCV_3028091 [Trichonephila clavipes]
MWGCFGGGKLLVETILRQTRTPSSVHFHEEWDKLPQQLLDNVVQKVWYDVWNCISPRWTYPRTDTFFFKVPASLDDVPFVRRSNEHFFFFK